MGFGRRVECTSVGLVPVVMSPRLESWSLSSSTLSLFAINGGEEEGKMKGGFSRSVV